MASWENDITCDNFDDGLAFSDTDDQGSLVRQPRQVHRRFYIMAQISLLKIIESTNILSVH